MQYLLSAVQRRLALQLLKILAVFGLILFGVMVLLITKVVLSKLVATSIALAGFGVLIWMVMVVIQIVRSPR